MPRFPEVEVGLHGLKLGGLGIVNLVEQRLSEAGVSADDREQFIEQAMGGTAADLLCTVEEWVTTDGVGCPLCDKRWVYHSTQAYVLVERTMHFADRHGPLTKTAPGDMEER